MSKNSESHKFDLHVLKQLENLFEVGELETFVGHPILVPGPDFKINHNPAILLKHRDGRTAESSEYDSQIRNKIACLLKLLNEKHAS